MKSSMLKRTWLLFHRQQSKRLLSSVQNNIFDRNLKKRHRKNHLNSPDSQYYNYLREESNRRLIDRIDDINKTFPFGLEIGSHSGNLYTLINSYPSLRSDNGGVGGIERLLLCDSTVGANWPCNATTAPIVSPLPVLCDEEYLPFKENTFDIVLSSLYLHWSNDLETVMNNVYKVLKPDGVFIASILGNNTLKELQDCFYFAENERRGGMSFHTSPFARPSDIAGLMQAANFNLPTVDIDTITISYPNAFVLMEHLSKMGEGSASINRSLRMGKDSFLSLAAIYQNLYGLEDGTVPATFEFIYMIGWKHHDSQPKPCKRGSAEISMKNIASEKK